MSENDIELDVKEIETRGTRIEIENSGCLAGFDYFKSDILSELKRVEHKGLEHMVYWMQLTYNETVDMLDVKNIAGSTIGYTLPPGVYEITDINLMIKSVRPEGVKVNITNDDNRLNSDLISIRTIRFTEKSLFHTLLGFTQSHSIPLSRRRLLQTC